MNSGILSWRGGVHNNSRGLEKGDRSPGDHQTSECKVTCDMRSYVPWFHDPFGEGRTHCQTPSMIQEGRNDCVPGTTSNLK